MSQSTVSRDRPFSEIKLDFPEGVLVIRVSPEIKTKYENDSVFAASIKQQAYGKLLQQKEKEKETSPTGSEVCETTGSLERSCRGSSSSMVENANIQAAPQQHSRGVNNNRPAPVVHIHTRTLQTSRVVTTKTAQKRGNSSLAECEEAEEVEEIERHMADPVASEVDHETEDSETEDEEGDVPGSKRSWTVKQTRTFLTVYASFKRKFDEPYSKKYKLWKKVAEDMSNARYQVTAQQCAVKLKNLRRTYKQKKGPGAQHKPWKFFDDMDKLFSKDPVIELDNVAEINDGGCPPKKQKLDESSKKANKRVDWKSAIIDIEKERVDVLRVIANSQVEKNGMLDRLTAAIEKIADK